MRPAGWVLQAACLSVDPDLFFPNGERGHALSQLEIARQVCLTCPVQAQCLALALGYDEQFGMWGGATPDERRSLKRGPRVRSVDASAVAAEPARASR